MSLLDTARKKSNEPSLVESLMKRKTREIVRAYRHSWDIYSELLQNSVDAINRRYRVLNDPDFPLYTVYHQQYPSLTPDQQYTGRIEITINVQRREIEVRDNGTGIIASSMEEFLLPEMGDKQVGLEYGFKGFGLTYAAFISDEFCIASKSSLASDSLPHELQLNGLFNWLTDEDGIVTFPAFPIPDVTSCASNWDNDWNTIVKVKLAEDYTTKFPAVSSVDQAIRLACEKDRLDGFEFILRTRTALGNTRVLFSKPPIVPIAIKLKVIFSENEIEEKPIPYLYYHPKDHDEMAQVVYDFANYYQEYKRPSFSKNFRALYHSVSDQEVGTRRTLRCDFALSAIASTRLSNIESALRLDDGIDSGDVGVSYGVHLAINGMPTGLRIDDWDNKGAVYKRYYVVVDADLSLSNQLDPGRKGISQYFARLISDKAIDLIGTTRVEDSAPFGSYAARHLDYGQGREVGGLPPQDFQIKITQVRQEAEQQLKDENLLARLRAYSKLIYPPTDEQEVIALFYELQMQDVIKGYKTIYLAGNAVYDAAFDYEIECSPQNTLNQDFLGIGKVMVQNLKSRGESLYVHRNHFAGQTTLPELCVEFKKSIGGLLDEINRRGGKTTKDPSEIDLLIVWDIDIPPSIPQTMYTIDEVIGTQRIFHGTTHRLGLIWDRPTEIKCIVLKEVLKQLPFPPSEPALT